MSGVIIPIGAPRTPQPRQLARNGLYPRSDFEKRMTDLVNHVARYRTKQVANFTAKRRAGAPTWNDGGPASRGRWRFAYHSSPYAGRLWAIITTLGQQLQNTGALHTGAPFLQIDAAVIPFPTNPVFGRVLLDGGPPRYDIIATRDQVGPAGKVIELPFCDPSTGAQILVPPDSDIEVAFAEVENADFLNVAIYEESLGALTQNGYLDGNVAALAPIYDGRRQTMATILRSMWRSGASHLFNWSHMVDTITGLYTPRQTASATSTNMIDGTSTGAVTASSPGYTVDLSNTLRLSDVGLGVPVTVWAYGLNTGSSNGQVKLLEAGTGAAINVGPFTTGLSWVKGTGRMSATAAKRDLQFSTAGGTLQIEAVSVFLQT